MKDLEEYLEVLKSRLERYLELRKSEKGRSKSFWNGVLSATQTHIEELEPIVNELTKIEL